ncbi:glutamine synthetase/guanido kinase [Sporormia fimetaria CBS 119925]|uniref:Glutamine synthetase n=1 Tax=Sporormia fimetaria CBS 119925 TaxID=1340428 RepID=A0A6A6VDB6_9PLEO|nr:glutamine synthetase/guanido kinase [Sporormia fimetaria CBS 119925]
MERQAVSPEPIKPTLDNLAYVVNNYPIIDNHAHNLLLPSHIDTVPFESITSEAQGRALRDTYKSLPHLRAVRQLRQLYKCADDATWEEVQEQRLEWLRTDPEALYERCFSGMHALLIDDGLAGADKVYDYTWHDRCTKAPSKRIVRIETVAEQLMQKLLEDATEEDLDDAKYLTDTWLAFTEDFEEEIKDAIRDGDVAGFKTVICYRTGLDVEADYVRAAKEVGVPFERYVARCIRKRKYRIERKPLNDYLVLRTLEILSDELPQPDGFSKPLQLHTGLGDNDINLRESNPAYLQPLIENYSHVPFVLLHSAYPYTRQGGYLATVYKHVYLDLGEVFPMVSRGGQKAILRQSLELVPGSKLLYSTDGHWFPETFWLANIQFREVWLDLLTEYVNEGELTPHQGINLTKDLLFNNSNLLYKLNYQADFKEMEEPPKALAWRPQSNSPAVPTPLPIRPKFLDEEQQIESPIFPPPPKAPQIYETKLFEDFMKTNPNIKFFYIQWLDYMATTRARVIPVKEFERLIRAGDRIGISKGNMGTLQDDTLTSLANPVGQIYVEPDLRSLRPTHPRDPLPAATVLSYWRDEEGHPLPSCPRTNLEVVLNDLQFNHGISLRCGFEIEVTFLKSDKSNTGNPAPLTTNHAWGSHTPQDWLCLSILAEITDSLSDIGIEVQQFHSESGPGQYEFVLAPQPALRAVDALIQARQVVSQIAALHDLRATLHPKPLGDTGAGTAAHVHISLDDAHKDKEHAFFVEGVLSHLPALCAFTMPETDSYARVKDDIWTGGTWVAWGTQNRETPLRKVEAGRWEVRCLDGFANMYFALGAIMTAGILGLRSARGGVSSPPPAVIPPPTIASPPPAGYPLPPPSARSASPPPRIATPDFPSTPLSLLPQDVRVNPSQLSQEERLQYGITQALPRSLESALSALETDMELREALPRGLVEDYLVMKGAEMEMLGKMEDGERRAWLVDRY